MKKLMSAAIAITLLLMTLSTGASADSAEKIAALTQVVEQTLKDNQYNYEYNAKDALFDLEFSLDSSLSSSDVTIYIYDDMVSVAARSPLKVQSAHLDKMAKYLTLVNDDIYYAQFRMDYETGSVSCRSCQLVEEVIPGTQEILVLLQMPIVYMDDYGDGIAQISTIGSDPDEVFKSIESAAAAN